MILLPQHPGFSFFKTCTVTVFSYYDSFQNDDFILMAFTFFLKITTWISISVFFFSSPKCGPNTLLYCTNEQVLQVFVFSCGFIWQWVNVKVSVLLRVMGGKDMFTTCSCFATKKKWRRTRLLISAGALQILTSHSPSLFPLRSTSGRVSVCPKRTRHLVLFIPSLPVVDFSFQK